MYRIWKYLVKFFLSALLFASPAYAADLQTSNNKVSLNSEEIQALNTLRKTLKVNSRKITELVNADKEELIEQDANLQQSITAVKAIEQKYPKAAFVFTIELDAKNPTKYQPILDSIVLRENEKRVISFDDGSFLVLQSKTNPKTTVISDTVSTMATELPLSHTHKVEVWGIYKAAELLLTTDYMADINAYYVYGTDVNVSYSAWYPTSVTSASASWISKSAYNSSQVMKSKGFFALRDSYGGVSRDFTYTLYTEITSSGSIRDYFTST
jgi:hypothetical protein